jgi:hypothetical protein
MNLLAQEIKESLEDIPESISGIETNKWTTSHVFYGNSPLPFRGQSRGRCPFVRYYRLGKDFDIQSVKPAGGTVLSQFSVQFVVNPPSVKSQEDAWDFAYEMFESFITSLREKDNWMDLDYSPQQLIVNPTIFVLDVNLRVTNSFPCQPAP